MQRNRLSIFDSFILPTSINKKFYTDKTKIKSNKTSSPQKLCLDILNNWHKEQSGSRKRKVTVPFRTFICLGKDTKDILFYVTQKDLS